MGYEDFLIHISATTEDAYKVRVATPMGSTGHGKMRLPFDLDELYKLRSQAYRNQNQAATTLGGQLFDALFTGEVLSLFDQSVARAREKRHILRIKLQLNIKDPLLAPLAGLPWELLYRKNTRMYLSQSSHVTLVRYLDVATPAVVPPFKSPLKILVVTGDPLGLDLEKEAALIKARCGASNDMEVTVLESAAYPDLEDELYNHDYDILHYMGHGHFVEKQGTLLFVDGRVTGADLGMLLRSKTGMRLVVLNACKTALTSDTPDEDPFAGVASALVMAGLPAVVAMQHPVKDDAAIAFAERFYTGLAKQSPVEDAVAAGRMKIKGVRRKSAEWAIPVLFMQAAAADLFGAHDAQPEIKKENKRPQICVPLPRPNDFVERPKEFNEIKQHLIQADGHAPVSISTAIHGAGGFGKTTLAAALCADEDIRRHFGDIFWVTLGKDNPDVLSCLSNIIQDLTGEKPVVETIEGAANALSDVLGDRTCLLVIDDVWKPIDLRPFLRGGSACVRLVTTRFQNVARVGKGNEVALDQMQTGEAADMLATLATPWAGCISFGLLRSRVDLAVHQNVILCVNEEFIEPLGGLQFHFGLA